MECFVCLVCWNVSWLMNLVQWQHLALDWNLSWIGSIVVRNVDVRMKERKRYSWFRSLLVVLPHLGHLGQKLVEIILVEHQTCWWIIAEVELTLQLRVNLDLALDPSIKYHILVYQNWEAEETGWTCRWFLLYFLTPLWSAHEQLMATLALVVNRIRVFEVSG